jgi:hypothetical protein
VTDCIKEYMELSKNIFSVSPLKFRQQEKFDDRVLEAKLKAVVSSRLKDPSGPDEDLVAGAAELLEDPLGAACCRTFVLTLHKDAIVNTPRGYVHTILIEILHLYYLASRESHNRGCHFFRFNRIWTTSNKLCGFWSRSQQSSKRSII